MYQGSLVRTLRIRLKRKLGNLGLLTSTLGDAGASVGQISTLQIGHTFTVRDFHMVLDDQAHLDTVLEAIGSVADCEVVGVFNRPFELHAGGKIETHTRVDFDEMKDFEAAVYPGVLEVVAEVDDNPHLADKYTRLAHTIAIVSDARGLRGVGRVRPKAVLPVLEAKAALLAKAARISSLPLVLDVETEEEFVNTVRALAPSVSGIMLDAIEGARAARITKRLTEELDVPVFHDDADAPAVAGLAAVINACRRTGRDVREVTVGQLGLGTAGGSVARLVMRFTGRPVFGEDVHPGSVSRHVAFGGQPATLDEIMEKCDVVVCNTGHGGVIKPSMVREGQAIIALSEPRPEIEPYDATLAGAAFAADGKAINMSVVVPGVFLGALAVKASEIDDEMKIAAAVTLANTALEGDLMPTPLDPNVHVEVASAVALAALSSGAASRRVAVDRLSPAVFKAVLNGDVELPL
jgi:malate dehydrogenase (oxaloacetate-decarboxylating)